MEEGTASLGGEKEVAVTTTYTAPKGQSVPAGTQIDIFTEITSRMINYPQLGRAVGIRARVEVDGKLLSLVVTPGT